MVVNIKLKDKIMIEINEAIEIIKNNLPDRKIIEISIEKALNYIAAKQISSPEPLPRFTNSAMDGFAVKWDDIKDLQLGDNIHLEVIGESAAGNPFEGNILNNQAIRINTGAMLPDDVNTVIPIEVLEEKEEKIIISKPTFLGANVRYEGEEIKKGDRVLNKFDRITIPVISMLSSLGVNTISVLKKPEISLIVTGSELVQNGGELRAGQIRNSNFLMLKTAINYAGGSLNYNANAKDSLQDIKDAISEAEKHSDIIIISGGVSVGPHDLVKQASSELGFTKLFWQIKQKPGKPMYFAKKDEKIIFGLPGNPVSSLNSFVFYIFPIIQYLRGIKFQWTKVQGLMEKELQNNGSRSIFYRVKLENINKAKIAKILEKQGSHIMSSMVRANGFIIVKPGQIIRKNDTIDVNLYPWEL